MELARGKQLAIVPKARCEFQIPVELDRRLEKIRQKAGTSKTNLLIAAVEQFVYGEETKTGVDGLHERLAEMMVRLRADLLEIRAHLDAAMQEAKGGDAEMIDRFRNEVQSARLEILCCNRAELENFVKDAELAKANLEEAQ